MRLKAVSPPATGCPGEEPEPPPATASFRALVESDKPAPSLLFTRLNTPSTLSRSSQALFSRPFVRAQLRERRPSGCCRQPRPRRARPALPRSPRPVPSRCGYRVSGRPRGGPPRRGGARSSSAPRSGSSPSGRTGRRPWPPRRRAALTSRVRRAGPALRPRRARPEGPEPAQASIQPNQGTAQ